MTPNIVLALTQWCEKNRDSLRDAGLSLKLLGATQEHGGTACVAFESAHTLLQVTVWNHMGMCDVDQLSLSSHEMLNQHHENLSAGQIAILMDGLAARARKG